MAPAGQCQLGFAVEDIDAFHQEMIAKGVPCLQPPEEEDFGDSWPGMPIPMDCRSGWGRAEEVVMEAVIGRLLPPHHHHRPLNDDRPFGRGD